MATGWRRGFRCSIHLSPCTGGGRGGRGLAHLPLQGCGRMHGTASCWPRWGLAHLPLQPGGTRLHARLSSTTTARQDGGGAAGQRLGAVELARSLVESRKSGTLTTVQLYPAHGGQGGGSAAGSPLYGSLMPYVLRGGGAPVVGLRPDESHIRNLAHVDMASFVVYPLTPTNINPSNFALPRVNLGGRLRRLEPSPEAGIGAVRRQYLYVHPGCKKVIDDLIFYEMEIEDTVYSTGGLQDTVHISAEQYRSAEPDAIMRGGRPILEWLNDTKRAIYLKLFCKEYAQVDDVGEIFMFSVDRRGFEVLAWRQSNRKWMELRFPFPYELSSVDDCKDVLRSSCAHLYDKYLKDVEGVEKFDAQTEMERELERQQRLALEDLNRRKRMAEPDLWDEPEDHEKKNQNN